MVTNKVFKFVLECVCKSDSIDYFVVRDSAGNLLNLDCDISGFGTMGFISDYIKDNI